MNRREFLGKTLSAGLGGTLLGPSAMRGNIIIPQDAGTKGAGSLSLPDLYQTCRNQLMNQYLPFWENGGNDAINGGFMCYLYPDGSVQDSRKDIWYQGRGIWVYSYLYNTIDKHPQWLKRAELARDFMVRHMHRGDGTWLTTVNRVGEPVGSIAIDRTDNIYGALFAAVGLIQLAKATGNSEDLELAKLSLRKSIEIYEDPEYRGVTVAGVDQPGLRAQGHSFMLVWVIPQLLELDSDPWFGSILEEHLDALVNKYWNSDYRISNEVLYHDYSRIPSQAHFMIPGHSIEAQWMGMTEAFRQRDFHRQKLFKERFRHLVEMSWDYVYDGTCDTGYYAEDSEDHAAGPVMDIKTMWAQTEVCIGSMLATEIAGEAWARDWLKRSWGFLQRTMLTDHGIWRQAVDRKGRDKQREGISIYRRGNFHQPRCLMYLMQSIARIFPGLNSAL